MLATGVGSMPGADAAAYCRGEVAGRARGAGEAPRASHLQAAGPRPSCTMTGRALAVVSGLSADLQPAGWRLTDAPGVDLRRARSRCWRKDHRPAGGAGPRASAAR
ncbi:MAG: hypothetical protein R2734_20285 [Nocardioides sp.]